jgi:hypothetical protein
LYNQIYIWCLSWLCCHYHLIMSTLVVMFFRFVTSGEIQRRAEFFEPFISGLTNSTVAQVSILVLSLYLFVTHRTKTFYKESCIYFLSISTPSCSQCTSILLAVIILRCISIVEIKSAVLTILALSDAECCQTGWQMRL